MLRSVRSSFEEYVDLAKGIPAEIVSNITEIEDPAKLSDTLAAHLGMSRSETGFARGAQPRQAAQSHHRFHTK